jgi:hypothetical protein
MLGLLDDWSTDGVDCFSCFDVSRVGGTNVNVESEVAQALLRLSCKNTEKKLTTMRLKKLKLTGLACGSGT